MLGHRDNSLTKWKVPISSVSGVFLGHFQGPGRNLISLLMNGTRYILLCFVLFFPLSEALEIGYR